ncbi:MAG: universal stress protein [Spirochaetaceae bacterium]|jgi:nucleotide-binding universal stress UspA family protein|nr:universal stress protein [Spirochaetaceae bacterium]
MVSRILSNVVVGISGSGASVHAAKYAIMMAKLYKCRVTAVYVVDTATLKQLTMSKIFVSDESSEFERNLHANGERYLSLVEELAKQKEIKIEKELRSGAVWTEILETAAEKKSDLIVLGGWEKDRDVKDIISHIHHEILLHSKCPVLIVKEPDIDVLYRHL